MDADRRNSRYDIRRHSFARGKSPLETYRRQEKQFTQEQLTPAQDGIGRLANFFCVRALMPAFRSSAASCAAHNPTQPPWDAMPIFSGTADNLTRSMSTSDTYVDSFGGRHVCIGPTGSTTGGEVGAPAESLATPSAYREVVIIARPEHETPIQRQPAVILNPGVQSFQRDSEECCATTPTAEFLPKDTIDGSAPSRGHLRGGDGRPARCLSHGARPPGLADRPGHPRATDAAAGPARPAAAPGQWPALIHSTYCPTAGVPAPVLDHALAAEGARLAADIAASQQRRATHERHRHHQRGLDRTCVPQSASSSSRRVAVKARVEEIRDMIERLEPRRRPGRPRNASALNTYPSQAASAAGPEHRAPARRGRHGHRLPGTRRRHARRAPCASRPETAA